MYMLDTNTMSYFFRKVPSVVERLQQLNPDIICISSVTAAELFYGVAKRNNQQLSRFLDVFLSTITILEWDTKTAEIYGKLRAEMEKEGVNIGEFQIKLLQKIEELTLYSIQQEKRINQLEEKLSKAKK